MPNGIGLAFHLNYYCLCSANTLAGTTMAVTGNGVAAATAAVLLLPSLYVSLIICDMPMDLLTICGICVRVYAMYSRNGSHSLSLSRMPNYLCERYEFDVRKFSMSNANLLQIPPQYAMLSACLCVVSLSHFTIYRKYRIECFAGSVGFVISSKIVWWHFHSHWKLYETHIK